MTPKTPGKAAEDWKKRAAESVASYVRKNCEESVLVQAVHDGTLRLELAIRFSGEREGRLVRQNLRTRTVLNSLCAPGVGCTSKDWTVESKILGQASDARLAVYESLRARTAPQSRGGWRLVLDSAPRGEQLAAVSSLFGDGSSAPGPAGSVTVSASSDGVAAAGGGRAGPAASDKFFSVTITVKKAS